MKVEVTLSYGGVKLNVVEECDDYQSIDDAVHEWTEGSQACDCYRSVILHKAGVLDQELPCNHGRNKIQLLGVKPFMVH